MDIQALFRRRLKQLIRRKYRSLDRFYLETDFSKGHLSEILRGKGSPSVATLVKLAKALDVEVKDFFIFPDRSLPHHAVELLDAAPQETLRRLCGSSPKSGSYKDRPTRAGRRDACSASLEIGDVIDELPEPRTDGRAFISPVSK